MVEKTNRITYRFNHKGEKIDESNDVTHIPKVETLSSYESELEELEQLIRNAEQTAEQSNSEIQIWSDDPLQEEQEYGSDISDDAHAEAQVLNWDGAVYGNCIVQEPIRLDQGAEGETQQPIFTHFNAFEKKEVTISKAVSLTWMQGALSVAGAIISGLLIGYMLLTLVFGITVWPFSAFTQPQEQKIAAADRTAAHAQQQGDESDRHGLTISGGETDSHSAGEEKIASDLGGGYAQGIVQLNDQAYTYHILQAGVFTQQKTRDEVMESLHQAGFPAHYIVDSSKKYYVFAGVAPSSSDADIIKTNIKGIETYRKPVTISLPSSMSFNGEAAVLKAFIERSNDLITMYAALVAAQLEQSSLSPIGEAAQAAWTENVEAWLALADETEPLWASPADKERATMLKEHLMEAQKQLESYQQKPKASYLWNVQAALVQSVLLQKDWFETDSSLS